MKSSILIALLSIFLVLVVTACSETPDSTPTPAASTASDGHGHSHSASLVSRPITRYGGPISVAFEVEPGVPRAGQPFKVSYNLRAAGNPVTLMTLRVVHEAPMHLILMSRDLSYFSHLHPQEEAEGRWAVVTTVPKPGSYLLFNEFVTLKDVTQLERHQITVEGSDSAGDAGGEPKLTPTLDSPQKVGELTTVLSASTGIVRRRTPTTFRLNVMKDGQPVTDLKPYLGAAGHVVIVSSDTTQFTHTHGEAHETGVQHTHTPDEQHAVPAQFGPQIEFAHTFNTQPGLYRIWVQFMHGGKVVTVSDTVEVVR